MVKDDVNQDLKGWVIVFIGGLFYMYQFAVRVSPNIMHDELLHVLSIDAGTLGTIIGTYYWSYTMMQIPLGMTMDRIGPRYFLCTAAFICALSCFIFGNTQNIYLAGASRFLMGMASACGLIGTIKLGTIWIQPKHTAKVTSLAILMGTAGAGLGGAPLRYVLVLYGLETTMEILAAVGILVGAIIYISVRIHPPINHQSEVPDIYKNDHPIRDLLTVVRNKQAWIVALYGMLMYVPITIIGIAWGVPFLEKYYQISDAMAASVVSVMFLGAALGSPLGAITSDLLKNRRMPMVLGAVMSAIIWSLVVFVENIPLGFMYALFFFGGIFYAFKTLSFASICEIMPRNFSGVSIAFVNMIVMTTGIIFHPLIGNMIEHHWNGDVASGVPVYSIGDYRFGLIVIPISMVISALILIFMRESHPESSIVKEYGKIPDTDVL